MTKFYFLFVKYMCVVLVWNTNKIYVAIRYLNLREMNLRWRSTVLYRLNLILVFALNRVIRLHVLEAISSPYLIHGLLDTIHVIFLTYSFLRVSISTKLKYRRQYQNHKQAYVGSVYRKTENFRFFQFTFRTICTLYAH